MGDAWKERRAEAATLAALAIAVGVPWWGVVAGVHLPIPDDAYASDLADGEWPIRVVAGRAMWTQGPWAWNDAVALGHPILPDPWNAVYALLPPVTALGVHWVLLLAIASAGSYLLAREHGASRSASAFAGFGFAWSGFFVSQLRHLSIMGVVVWFPVALWFLERAAGAHGLDTLERRSLDERATAALAFGAAWGMQVIAGFPQTAYYAALVYAGLIVARTWHLARAGDRGGAAAYFGLTAIASAAGAAFGAAALLPLREIAALSERARGVTWEFASDYQFFVGSVVGFFLPYPRGDGSIDGVDFDSKGLALSLFWEQHGYVGWLTVPLIAVFALRRRLNTFVGTAWCLAGALAFLMVLGPATPVYWLVWKFLPLMDSFRFPTRFLFVVELALVHLAAHGLDAAVASAPRRIALVGVYALDLVYWNMRQLPLADAARWLASPTASALATRAPGRLFPRGAPQRHVDAFFAARSWRDLEPYYAHRAYVQPNSNALYGVPTITGYLGLAPAGQVALVGSIDDPTLLGAVDADPAAAGQLLDLLGARYVVSSPGWHVDGTTSTTRIGDVVLHERPGARRARVVYRATHGASEGLAERIRSGAVDLRGTAVFAEGDALPTLGPGPGEVTLVEDTTDRLSFDVASAGPGLLVVADAWYPGWTASIDGVATEIHRVDLALRGVVVPNGTHRVEMTWTGGAARTGTYGSGAVFAAGALCASALAVRRARRR